MLNLAQFANVILRGVSVSQSGHEAILADLSDRIANAPKTPLDLAAEKLKSLVPGQTWAWYLREAWELVKLNRPDRTRVEKLVVETYQTAYKAYKATGEVTR